MTIHLSSLAAPLTQTEIRKLIPHAGSMCLLDQVLKWDDNEIECLAISHRALDNPLRHNDVLPIHAGIEYCAQAIALHGGLTNTEADKQSSEGSGTPRRGYLAVILSTQWSVQRLDDCLGALNIIAKKQVALQQGAHYAFAIQHEGHTLLTGQAVVALE